MALMDLVGRLMLDGSGWERGLAQARAKSSTFANDVGKNLTSRLAGAFSVASIVYAGKAVLQYAGEIDDLGKRAGISTDMLQGLSFAALQNGATVDDMVKALEKLAKAQRDAGLSSNSSSARAFQTLGFDLAAIKNQNIQQLFLQVADAIGRAGDSGAAMAASLELMGRSAGKLKPAFKAGLQEMMDLAKAQGAILAPEDIKALDTYGDKWTVAAMKGKVAIGELTAFIARMHEKTTIFGENIRDFLQVGNLQAGRSWEDFGERKDRRRAKFEEEFGSERGSSFRLDQKHLFKTQGQSELEDDAAQREFDAQMDEYQLEAMRLDRAREERERREAERGQDKPEAFVTQRGASDALTNIGNFLGSAVATSDPTQATRQVVNNTARTNVLLQEMGRHMQAMAMQLATNPIFP